MGDIRKNVVVSVDDGCMDYEHIASAMFNSGTRMGHSTVRNILVSCMEKFAVYLMAMYGVSGDPRVVARTPLFQNLIAKHVQEILAGRNSN